MGALEGVLSSVAKRADFWIPSASDAGEDAGEGARALESGGGECLIWPRSSSR